MDAKEEMQKSTTSGDFINTDAVLNIGGSDITRFQNFITELQKEPTILSKIRIVYDIQNRVQFEKIRFDEDAYFLAPSAEGSQVVNETDADFEYSYLDTKSFAGYTSITDIAKRKFRDGSLETSLIEKMMYKLRTDIAKIVLNGDTTSLNPTLAYMDGFRKLANTGTVINAAGAELTENVLDQAIESMPDKYATDGVIFLMNRRMLNNFSRLVRARSTNLGDMFYVGTDNQFRFNNTAMQEIPYMTAYQFGGNTCNDIIMVDPRNFVLGFLIGLTVEPRRNTPKFQDEYYVKIDMGMKIEETNAVVKIQNIKYK